jgi:hypothetical protein
MKKTNISQKIMSIEYKKAMYDNACKNVLKDKQIIARILKECVEEFAHCDLEDIISYAFTGKVYVGSYPVDANSVLPEVENEDTEDVVLNEGTIRYDIRFTVTVPHSDEEIKLIINIEAQNDQYLRYELVTRAIYYCSRMISAQKTLVFLNSDYHEIRKVYSIWLCMNPPNKEKNSITRYDVSEETVKGCVKRPKKSFDLLSVIMVYLGEAYRDNYDDIIGLLSPLLSNQMPQEEKCNILEEKYGIAMTKDLERGVSQMCNLSKGVWEGGLQQGMEQGLQQGMQQGIQQGIQQGRQQGKQQSVSDSIVSLMKNLGFTIEQAMNALGISDNDKPEYEEMLKETKK